MRNEHHIFERISCSHFFVYFSSLGEIEETVLGPYNKILLLSLNLFFTLIFQ
jgi:hypothetical protein